MPLRESQPKSTAVCEGGNQSKGLNFGKPQCSTLACRNLRHARWRLIRAFRFRKDFFGYFLSRKESNKKILLASKRKWTTSISPCQFHFIGCQCSLSFTFKQGSETERHPIYPIIQKSTIQLFNDRSHSHNIR
jgi:hypothetical protein